MLVAATRLPLLLNGLDEPRSSQLEREEPIALLAVALACFCSEKRGQGVRYETPIHPNRGQERY